MVPRKKTRRRPLAAEAIDAPNASRIASEAPTLTKRPANAHDTLSLLGVVAGSAVLFATTLSANAALGDSTESIAGVQTVGVLHAPGYPGYVAAARAFSELVPFGSLAWRVNVFSVACSALTVGVAYLIARLVGASRTGAAMGAFSLATSASFWFNAGFAKHYAFSGLLVATAAFFALRWEAGAPDRFLIAGGAALGLCIGASWELAVIMLAGVVVLIAFGDRRRASATFAASALALVLVATGCYVFLIVRARAQPQVNWGDVTNARRLVAQITQQDFRSSAGSPAVVANAAVAPVRALSYLGIMVRDLGLGAIMLAAFGCHVAVTQLTRARKLFLVVVATFNVLAVVFVAGVDHINGFLTGLVAGGYLLDALLVLSVLISLGATFALDWGSRKLGAAATARRYASRVDSAVDRWRTAISAAIVIIVLVPSMIVHYHLANHRTPPIADRYAQRIFRQLPARTVLFVFQADLTFPLVYRQAVFAERPDVGLVVVTSLHFGWYREQLARQLGLSVPLASLSDEDQVDALIKVLAPQRPIFLDTTTMQIFRERLGFRPMGLVGELVVGSKGPSALRDPNALSAALLQADRDDGVAGHGAVRFPNAFVHYLYERAHIELAKQFAQRQDLNAVQTELARAVDVYPDDQTTMLVLKFSRQSDTMPADVFRVVAAL